SGLTLGDTNRVQVLAPQRLGTAADWSSGAAGSSHSLGIRTDGSLWVWGQGSNNELGLGEPVSRSTPIAFFGSNVWQTVWARSTYSLARQNDGSLWSWGNNNSGQLGRSNTTITTVPGRIAASQGWITAAAGQAHVLAIAADG